MFYTYPCCYSTPVFIRKIPDGYPYQAASTIIRISEECESANEKQRDLRSEKNIFSHSPHQAHLIHPKLIISKQTYARSKTKQKRYRPSTSPETTRENQVSHLHRNNMFVGFMRFLCEKYSTSPAKN